MTASGRARKPAQRPATEAGTPSSSGQPADTAALGDTGEICPEASAVAGTPLHAGPVSGAVAAGRAAETGPPANAEHRPPADADKLRQEIERTREQLGETVEQLAAKADVKGRARAKAAELAVRVKDEAAQARARGATQAGAVRGQLADRSAGVRQKAVAVGGTAKTQLRARAAGVREAAPEPLRRTVAGGASTAQQRRIPLAVAAVTLIAGYVALRWWRKR